MINVLGAFFKLIRWPNLVFIAITQCLFHFCVVEPSVLNYGLHFPLHLYTKLFVLLCTSSVLIAAGGYVINDYFDINIDLVTKPNDMVVDKYIPRRWALLWHFLLSGTGILLGVFISWKLNNWIIAATNLLCVLLLWIYSTNYKRRLLTGNLLISALTAWVVMVLLIAEVPYWWRGALASDEAKAIAARLSRIGVLYAAFAFIISLIREIIKDMEDVEGDRKEGCKTMPIVWGVNATKVFTAVWVIVLTVSLIIIQFYVVTFGSWVAWIAAAYLVVFVVAPLILLLKKLQTASQKNDYHTMSRQLKFIMLAGILSMLFFYLK